MAAPVKLQLAVGENPAELEVRVEGRPLQGVVSILVEPCQSRDLRETTGQRNKRRLTVVVDDYDATGD